jgi:uncharacterized protein
MDDWIHEGLPFWNEEAEVWLTNGQVRRVFRSTGQGGIRFTDCRHPLSNVICDDSLVVAWRPLSPSRPGSTVAALKKLHASRGELRK